MSRGGPRTLGRALRTNTSGVAAIRFGYEGEQLRVYVAAKSERTSFSVAANGRRGACSKAIDWRTRRGCPAPAIGTVMRKLREFEAS